MKDFEQLADTGTADVSAVIREKWAAVVEEAARPNRVFRDLILQNTDLLGKDGDIIRIQRRGTITASAITESGTVVPSTLTYTEALKLEPSSYAAGVKVSQQAVNRAYVNILRDANVELGIALAQKEDEDIATVLSAATTNTLYGGTATGTADIATGDVLTPQLIAKAKAQVEKVNFHPDTLIIAPEQQYTLSTHPQFTNASYFGSRDVIAKGLVPNYLGMKILTTTNTPSGTGGTGTDVPYHVCILADSKKAAAIALKSNVVVNTDYLPLEHKHLIVASHERDQGLLNDSAVCTITVSDS